MKFARTKTERYIVEDRQDGVERIVLKYHGNIAVARAHIGNDLAANGDLTPIDILQSCNGTKQSALAATRRPDEHGKLPVLIARSIPLSAWRAP